jgi:hypothetical protein
MQNDNRNSSISTLLLLATLLPVFVALSATAPAAPEENLSIRWEKNFLTISGNGMPGEISVNYLEAYCRPGSTDRDWKETVIGHKTELVSVSDEGRLIKLKCTLNDGVVVQHEIRAGSGEVDFRLVATNPTDKPSLAHWAQPCIRLDKFTGRKQQDYLERGFVFLDGKLSRLPTSNWATKARYVPGQVWCPKGVNRNDVNPRPLSDEVPSNGLIGCFSADDRLIMATAFEPYQELFQGVVVCLHSDFRIGGLEPGETKKIKGKIYVVPNDVPKLLKRYERDFPEQTQKE